MQRLAMCPGGTSVRNTMPLEHCSDDVAARPGAGVALATWFASVREGHDSALGALLGCGHVGGMAMP